MIDWESSETSVFLNQKMNEVSRRDIEKRLLACDQFQGHVWLATSGSTAQTPRTIKCAALSKQAILCSAQAVNHHLNSTSSDLWLNPLPTFHVGGLGIYARGYLSSAKVVDYDDVNHSKWNPIHFHQMLLSSRATLTALVPAQVHDLVANSLAAPSSLRAVIVGGAALTECLYLKARTLGWNLLPSYGMTECCSQVATASLLSLAHKTYPAFKVLSHVELKIDDTQCIWIKSPSLLTAYAEIGETGDLTIIDPKRQGWFCTEDQGTTSMQGLQVFGRKSDFVKIGGEGVNLQELKEVLCQVNLALRISNDMELIAYPDTRLGHVIHLVIAGEVHPLHTALTDQYNARVLPFAKIRKSHYLPELPRSKLGKLLQGELYRVLNG